MRKNSTIQSSSLQEFIADDVGINNGAIEGSISRLIKGGSYKDLSTVWVVPTRGVLKPRVVWSWINLVKPMNQTVVGPLFIEQDEVGIAYQKLFDMILEHPELRKFKYILTVEEDNLPPSDGLLKLYESIDDYDCVAGLYWTKSSSISAIYSQPMIYGDPRNKKVPKDFTPQVPIPETVQECNGLGMGFNLWKIDTLKTKLKKMPKPWFKTVQEKGHAFTQDLYFFNEAARYGFRCACDTRVKVGHLANDGIVW